MKLFGRFDINRIELDDQIPRPESEPLGWSPLSNLSDHHTFCKIIKTKLNIKGWREIGHRCAGQGMIST